MTKLDQTTVLAMAQAGIEFGANVRTPWGGETLVIQPQQVAEFVEDPEAFYAKQHGASREEYRQWIETDGTPRCGARTRSGKRCRNSALGRTQRQLPDWLQEDGGFCSIHSDD